MTFPKSSHYLHQFWLKLHPNSFHLDNVSFPGYPANFDYFIWVQISDTICSEGRDSDALEKEGTGTGLWLQNGPTPDSYMEVPMKRSKAIKKGWTKCNCFIGMGKLPNKCSINLLMHALGRLCLRPNFQPNNYNMWVDGKWNNCETFFSCTILGYHNFYDLPHVREANCTDSLPAFLLYNKKGELHGFGFVVPGYASSPKFEHPPSWAVRVRCDTNASNLFPLHIFTSSHPS